MLGVNGSKKPEGFQAICFGAFWLFSESSVKAGEARCSEGVCSIDDGLHMGHGICLGICSSVNSYACEILRA